MEGILQKYSAKLIRAGLAKAGGVLIGLRDGETIWNRTDVESGKLEAIMTAIDRNAVLLAEPAEPYRTIIDYLAATSGGIIAPRDFETRIFLHDLPVLREIEPEAVAGALRTRRGVVIEGGRVLSLGKSSPEAAFVIYSSVCFACFVKFFVDTLYHIRHGALDSGRRGVLNKVVDMLDAETNTAVDLPRGPFCDAQQIVAAMEEAGRLLVERRLVDSRFGNISYFAEPFLYISRSGSALDELGGRIMCVSLADMTAPPQAVSTEFPAHREIVVGTKKRAVLHGHPKFAVILSMDCEHLDCAGRDTCHERCSRERFAVGIPVVAGEAGGGPYGLSNTVPPAMRHYPGVIVYGHGLFTVGQCDFNDAFKQMAEIENSCRREVLRRISMACLD